MTPHGQSAWVVGGAGFLGRALVRLCRAAGECLVIDPACGDGGVSGAGGDPAAVAQALALTGLPSVVYCCAATRGGDAAAYRRVYVETVQQLTALLPGVRLVFCSSTAVYEGRGEVTEDSPTAKAGDKLQLLQEAEHAALEAGGAVARLAPLYGENRCELLRRHIAGEPQLPGTPERVLNYLHVEDAANALYRLGTARALPHRIYNVCGESLTKAQAYAMLAELTGRPASPTVAQAARRGGSDHRVCAARLKAELNWTPQRSLREFIRKAILA